MIFLKKEEAYLPFCDGSPLKNKNVEITLSPDIAFRLERLAELENKTTEQFVSDLISRETEKAFKSNKGIYKKYFE